MQAKSRVLLVLVIVLISAMVLSACGGSAPNTDGRTWFNLPAAKVNLRPDGTVSAYGIPVPVGSVLPAATVAQLQAAGVQQLEARWGRNGVHIYVNGEELPYVEWNSETAGKLQDIIRNVPGLPNAGTIASALPWLRRVGSGVKIQIPPAEGVEKMQIPAWKGETAIAPQEAPAAPTIGPLVLDSISFDKDGKGYNAGVPLESLGAPVNLPPNVMQMINSMGIQKLQIKTEPDGLNVAVNDGALTKLAYDSAALERLLKLVGSMIQDQSMAATFNDLAAKLPGADIQATISFTGEPAGALALSNVGVEIGEDGSLKAMGITLPGGAMVPASALQMLQSSNIQQLDVNLGETGINLSANGQSLPAISWTPESLAKLGALAAPLAGMPQAQLDGLLNIIKTTGVNATVKVPPAAGAEPVAPSEPAKEPSFAPVDLGEFAPPIIRADLGVDSAGNVTNISEINLGDLKAMGLPASITLPPNIVSILKNTGASQVGIQTDAGQLEVTLDGSPALTLNYDVPALQEMFNIVKPLIGVKQLEDPNISKLIHDVVMPLAAGAQVDVTLDLQ